MNEDFDIISMLSSLLSPAEAEAAPRTQVANQIQDPTAQLLKQLQLANQQKRMEMTGQANQLRERELALREQKSRPPQQQDIQAQLAQILQGSGVNRQADNDFGIPDLDIRSRNPATGTPYFSNYRAADFDSPERKAQVNQLYQERQGKVAAARAAQPKAEGGLDEATLARASQLSTILNAAKVPNETIGVILRATFPGIHKAKQAQTAKPVPQDKLGNFYHKQTGAPATEAFTDTEPDQETLKRDYISLNPKDKEKLGAIQQLENTITQYERMGGPGGSLDLPAEPGLLSAGKGRVGMQLDRWSGGLKSADLDSVNSQITQLARAFGGDSRVSDKEMALLRGSVINDGDNQQAVMVKMNNLKRFRDTVAKLIPIPGLQGKYTREEQDAKPVKPTQPRGAPATQQGIPPGRVPMINPQGKPVTLPAAQVSDALKAGYQPYGAQ
jgi:hypothetical protein